jgi:HemY protein
MRAWFWTLLLAVVAVAVAVVLRAHPGKVLLLVSPYRVELSLTLAVLLLIALFVAIYVGLRLLAWLLAIPERMRAWRGRRAQARDHELLERGWIGLLEGRYAHAEKDLARLLDQTKARNRRVLAALSAARAAQGLGEFVRRDVMLDRAREAAGNEPGLIEAVATVTADLLLEQGQPERALEVLAPLQDGGARHLHTLRLLLRAERALGHHERVFTLARGLARRGALAPDEALRIVGLSGAARLRATAGGDSDNWRAIWKELKAEERLLPDIALAGAAAFEAAGEADEAARILEAAIAHGFDARLLAAYSRCDASQVPRRLERAEKWLQQRPTDADVLSALGMLCLTGQLWGQAERYLRRAVERRADARTHALLGSLYDRLNRQNDAVRHWRLATAAGIALPVLAGDDALPAADTHADPSRVDPESGFLSDAAEAPAPVSAYIHESLPAEPPAADYVLDPDARGRAEPLRGEPVSPSPSSVPLAAESPVDIEDYFDSAPIPVAGLGAEEPEPEPTSSSGATPPTRDHATGGVPPKPGRSGDHGKS